MSIRHWWKGFTTRHIAAPEPYTWTAQDGDVKASDVLAVRKAPPRVIMMACERPKGLYIKGTWRREQVLMGWRVFAHNDGERAEVLCAWIRTLNREGSHA